MRRIQSLFLILCMLSACFNLFAQEDAEIGEETPPEADSVWITDPYGRGDRTFTIQVGALFPTYFTGSGIENRHGLSIMGGTGALSFNYFLTPHIFAGAELAGMFTGTRGGNMLYIIPFGGRIGYQFVIRRFEIPVSLMAGAAYERYLGKGYLGPILKPGFSVFWRYNPDWSFGLNTMWWFIPQWPKNGNNAIGNFLELTFSVRHHF